MKPGASIIYKSCLGQFLSITPTGRAIITYIEFGRKITKIVDIKELKERK